MTMRYFVLIVIAMGLAGCAPDNIATGSCQSVFLSTHDAWSCTVKANIVGQASSIPFKTESRNHVAQVSFAMQVTKGTLRITYADLSGKQQLLVTPSEPANVNMQTRLRRDDRSFSLFFEPVGGVVEGLSGTVKYSTP
jgi:hypothetical protein